MSNLRKCDIVRVLKENNVDFDEDATVVQLRPLYDAIVFKLPNQKQTPATDATNLNENAGETETDQTPADELVQQQQQRQREQQQLIERQQQQIEEQQRILANLQQQTQQMNRTNAAARQPANVEENLAAAHDAINMENREMDRQIELSRKKIELIQLNRQIEQTAVVSITIILKAWRKLFRATIHTTSKSGSVTLNVH